MLHSSSSTPPVDEGVIGGNAKIAKFDRQLRLWGAEGQAALEAAHVVALGATPAIAEALKSLVLTGVPTITLVDERVVTPADVGTNYFVAASSLGTSLAAAVLQTVCPLGEQCCGIAAGVTPEAWAEEYTAAVEHDWRAGCLYTAPVSGTRPGSVAAGVGSGSSCADDVSGVRKFMAAFASVVRPDRAASPSSSSSSSPYPAEAPSPRGSVPPPSLILVSERYADLSPLSPLVRTSLTRSYPDTPVVLVRSNGWLGFVQVHAPSRVMLRPHNPNQVKMEDLRIFEPFPALQAWFDAHDPDDAVQFPAESADALSLHSHLPYPCILHHAYRQWWSTLSADAQQQQRLASSPSIFPLSSKEYRDISNIVAGMVRRPAPPEESFLEAMEKCTAKLNRPVVQQLPAGLQALLSDPRCADPVRVVTALQSRLAPLSRRHNREDGDGGAASANHLLRVWACPEVLVWFVLRAVQLFLSGVIGREEEEEEQAAPSPPTVDGAGMDNEEAPSHMQHTTKNPTHTARYHMPFSGYLPDFTTTTMWYRELQDLYSAKHRADIASIAGKAWELVMEALAAHVEARAAQSVEENGTAALLLEVRVGSAVRPLLEDCAATIVANIWDLRGVVFSEGYDVATEEASEWRQCLGRRLRWILHNIAYDVDTSEPARRAACLAVAQLCKEELQRCAAAERREEGDSRAPPSVLTGQDITDEFVQLMALGQAHALVASAEEDGEAAQSLPSWMSEDVTAQQLLPKACEEVARWVREGVAVQLPSVAASTGALAAQESVKLIMRIRIPCGQPMMYDGYTNKIFTL